MRISSLQTKTNSRRASASARSILRILLFAIAGFILLSFFRGGVGIAASFVFNPIVSVKTWFLESSGTIPSYFRTQHALIGTIQSLENQLQEREGDAFAVRELQIENAELSTLLSLKQESRIIAGILLHPNQTPYDTFLIDRGARDGIVDGATVYIEGDIAVGIVARAYPQSSLVSLVSSPGLKTTAYIFGPNIFVQAEGVGGGVLRVAIPQGIPLAIGNLVVLPGAGSGVYGEIVSVEAVESDPQKYGYVTTSVPLQSIRFVSVATEAAPQISYETALEIIKTATTTLFNVTVLEEVRIGTTTATTTLSAGE
jgi:cell shape-determining protein MreC